MRPGHVAAVIVGLAGLATALSQCAGPIPPPVTVRIGLFAVQDFLPYFVMRDRGFDARHGLRFEERQFAGGAGAIDAMVAGTVDVCPAVGTFPLVLAAERGLVPDRIVAVAANNATDAAHPVVGVVASPSVRTWKDLTGATIATNARNSITSAAVIGRLRDEGVEGFSLVEMSFSNMGLGVAGGNVAAAGMNEPFLTQSLRRGDGHLLGWVMGGAPIERGPFTSIVFGAGFARGNPDTVKAYLRAHLDAVAWMASHPAEARALLARRLDLTPDVGREVRLALWPADARHDPGALTAMQNVFVRSGLQRAAIAPERLRDETLLSQVLRGRR